MRKLCCQTFLTLLTLTWTKPSYVLVWYELFGITLALSFDLQIISRLKFEN